GDGAIAQGDLEPQPAREQAGLAPGTHLLRRAARHVLDDVARAAVVACRCAARVQVRAREQLRLDGRQDRTEVQGRVDRDAVDEYAAALRSRAPHVERAARRATRIR